MALNVISLLGARYVMSESIHRSLRDCNFVLIPSNRYETSSAIIETEISTVKLAQEVRNRATQAQIPQRRPPSSLRSPTVLTPTFLMRQADGLYIRMQAQPHLPSGVLDAEDTITATRAEA
jgi:hypothetical protein